MTRETDECPKARSFWDSGRRSLFRYQAQPGSVPAQPSLYPRRIVPVALTALLLLLALASQSGLAIAQAQPAIEEQARALDQQLICPVCPGETLHQSQATLAKQMRQIIRERLAAGQSEQEIIAYFVSVYGDSVLAAPPREGFGLVAWLVPPLALIIGGIAVLYALRVLRKSPAPDTGPEVPTGEAELERYLQLVDQEMGGAGEPATTGQAGTGDGRATNG